jgi:hypothetical protein
MEPVQLGLYVNKMIGARQPVGAYVIPGMQANTAVVASDLYAFAFLLPEEEHMIDLMETEVRNVFSIRVIMVFIK